MNMSDRIKERRMAMGMTQEELGERLGLQKSAIAKYENGRVENIKRTIIMQMAEVLECAPSYLLGFDAEYSRSDLKEIVVSDPNDIRLLNAYHNASEDVKAGIRSILGIKG